MNYDKEDKIKSEKYNRPYLVDQGHGCRTVQFKAWRVEIPSVFGYGMTEDEAIHDLIAHVQPHFVMHRC